jgi:hypothetical protein
VRGASTEPLDKQPLGGHLVNSSRLPSFIFEENCGLARRLISMTKPTRDKPAPWHPGMDLPHKLIRLSSDDPAGMQPFVVCWIFPAFANFGTLAELRNQSPMLEFCIVPNREHIFHKSDIAADERFANDVDFIPERCEYPQLFLFPLDSKNGQQRFSYPAPAFPTRPTPNRGQAYPRGGRSVPRSPAPTCL